LSKEKSAHKYATRKGIGGAPNKSDNERRSNRLMQRYTLAESASIQAAAAQVGLSPTDYIRNAALNISLPSPRSGRTDAETLHALHRLAQTLAPIGNNINQIAHAANVGKTLEGKINNSLDDLNKQLSDIHNLIEKVASNYDS
jgi:hypothetical protein